MTEFKNLDRLNPAVRKVIEPYLGELLELHGGGIISVVLYGSATGADFIPGKSDVNLLVVFERLGFGDFKKSLKLISRGIGKRITAPLFLTRSYIETSADVFPIEFFEMKENNIVLYGEDLLSGLDIKWRNIRLQCEQQLKGKLIRLRQAYLEIGLKKKGMEALLKESLNGLMPIFRNLIRLQGKTPPVKKEEVIAALADEFKVDGEVFTAILRDKSNDERIASQDVEVFFERYLEEVRKLANAVDTLEGK